MVARHTTAFEALLVDSAFEGEVFRNEPMARHTTYRIGGRARYFIQVSTLDALSKLVALCTKQDISWIVIGKGSNLLVSDAGFDGVIITLGQDFRLCRFDDEHLCFTVGAGATLAVVVQEAFKRGLAGLEFAVGTPGTMGGALRMNAGSAQEWIGARVRWVLTFSAKKGLRRYQGSDIVWSYRASSIPADEIILECEIAVEKGQSSVIREKMEQAHIKRKANQPLNYPSCGSVFKNPEGKAAATLIEQIGLKGYRIGGAMVSELHANFIVNVGNARADDVVELIRLIQTKVNDTYDIELQPEVKFLGFA
ncbi:MAG: UDP-N-acetylmuramate dehydrogenase [Eggerthellaceae bacterium]|nr:UDP-N-acetylmuramate dehydrogenase [Eggerthellaceae bacterium]